MGPLMTQRLLNENEKRLFLLDAMALIYRAHFALIRSPRFTSSGLCTSAVFGLVNTIFDLLNREQPTHLAAAFDTPEPTHRHLAFEQYKAQREAMPEDLSAQIPYVFQLLEALNIPILKAPGYEADDILGTLARQAESEDFTCYLVTPDKDCQQLVSDCVTVYKPGRQGSQFELLGVHEVLAHWNIQRIDQVIEVLGLMGDNSDNIPGVPGIGPKTAQKLIEKYDNIENLIKHADELKGKQKERVQQYAEQAQLSKRLVTIDTHVPLEVQLDALATQPHHHKNLKSLFMELEFDSLGKKIFGASFSAGATRAATARQQREQEIQQELFAEPVEQKTIRDVPHQYHVIRTAAERHQLIERLSQQSAFCFDTETTDLNPRQAAPLGIAICFEPHEAFYVVCPAEEDKALQVLEEFRPLWENEHIEKIGHNLKYDLTLLKWHGFKVHGKLFDTMLAHAMKEPEMKHGLDYLSNLYLGYQPIATSELIGPRGDNQRNMRDVPLQQVAEYACEDADVTLQISHVLRPDLERREVHRVCHEVECPLIPVLVDMEHEGIRLDSKALQQYSQQLQSEIDKLEITIYQAAGREFNINSPKQLGIILYDELQLESNPPKTATGQYSTREAELLRLAGRHEIVNDVLEYRNAMKLKSVYVDQLPLAVNPNTDRVHTHYNQSWTATGRMQSNDPNLQTIPVRKTRGREIRAAFVPRNENYLLLAADYSQVELRIMAELSGDEGMLQSFQEETDIHTVTAAKVYKVPLSDVTREMRDKAKTVNFGIIYGISAFGLQQRLNIPREEARDVIDNYFEKYPGVRSYIDDTIEFARENGYVCTLTGRRRPLRDINSRNRSLRSAAERLAMNSPIQGTSADLLKLAMIRVDQLLNAGKYKTKMLLTVHDEIVFDLYRQEHDEVVPLIAEAMRSALPMKVPLVVEMGVGENWLEAH